MARTTRVESVQTTAQPMRLGVDEGRRFPAIWGWAALGVSFLLLQLYTFSSWILSGHAKRVPAGADPIPGWQRGLINFWQFGGLVILAVVLYFFLVRPWRREGRVSLDGLLILGMLTVYWQDPFVNFSQQFLTYNTGFINFGSWLSDVPFQFGGPNAHIQPAEPILWLAPFYLYAAFPLIVLISVLMRKTKERWPGLGVVSLIGISFGICTVVDLVFEPIFMRQGLWVYPGAIRKLSVFSGTYYQFPIYEGVIASIWWLGLACLRHFRNDRGETFAERGLDRVRVGGAKRTGLRFLALVGAMNLTVLAYGLAMQLPVLHSDTWPKAITDRSYLMGGVCGEGTDFACPGPGIPIYRKGAAHFTPEGELRVPAGVKFK